MADEYKKFLAEKVLNEKEPVSEHLLDLEQRITLLTCDRLLIALSVEL